MQLWIVGYMGRGECWELVGVFDAKDKAIAACKDEHHFIGPATLNQVTPEDRTDWPDCYYPLKEAAIEAAK